MKEIKIEYPVVTYEELIIDIDKLIDICINNLKSEGIESIDDCLLDEFGNNMDYYLKKYGLNELNYEENAWDLIIEETYYNIEARLDELGKLPL